MFSAAKLVEEDLSVIEENGWKARTSCSYTRYWRDQHPERSSIFV
nr:hypothetical protein [uncultured Peptostreptococcus sp.]